MHNEDPQGYLGYYAGFVSRLVAFVVDTIVTVFTVIATTWFISVTVNIFQISNTWTHLLNRYPMLEQIFGWIYNPLTGSLVALVFILLYYSLFLTLLGQTPGKLLLGVRVLTVDGHRVSFGRAVLRTFAYIICMVPLFLGFIWVLIDDQRQGWHDKIARTYVVYAWEARPDEHFLVRLNKRMQRLASFRAAKENQSNH
jgi:uncharacterized RDD family membrane protein YckC